MNRDVRPSASTRTKLLVRIQLVLLAILVIGVVLRSSLSLARLESSFVGEASQLTRITALGLSDAVWTYNAEGMGQLVDAVFVDPDVLAVQVTDPEGKTLLARNRQGPGATDSLTVSTKVVRGTIETATLSVVLSREKIHRELLDEISAFGALMLFLSLGTVLVVLVVVSRALRPLKLLMTAIKDLAEGKAPEGGPVGLGNDEVAFVYGRFLAMAEILRSKSEAANHLAFFDPLTGLPNRTQAYAELETIGSRSSGFRVSIVDVDDFKTVNDTIGARTGDALLRQVASRLDALCRSRGWWAGRLGDDEFLVLNTSDFVPGSPAVGRIVEALGGSYVWEGFHHSLTVSLGYAEYPADCRTSEDLLRSADTALMAAKAAGKGCFQGFTAAMGERLKAQALLDHELRFALERNELLLEFQAQYSHAEGRVSSFEALLRWNSPVLGRIPPSDFISIAEKNGLIVPIGHWVLEQAFAFLEHGAGADAPGIDLSVNLSSVQIMEADFLPRVRRIVEGTTVSPRKIVLEITESTLMQNIKEIRPTIRVLQDLGFRLSLDDFGIGYLSLSYLRDLPFYELKIDRSFLVSVEQDEAHSGVFRSIVGLAHDLNLTVVVEGVETAGQWAFSRSAGCQKVQGYFVSPSLHGDLVAGFLGNPWTPGRAAP